MSTLVKSPLPELQAMQQKMEESLEEGQKNAGLQPETTGWQPQADLWEDEESLVIEIELPGVDQQGIDVQIEGQTLVVQGERSLPTVEGRNYRRVERSYGRFSRQFNLPEGIERGRIRAQWDHGLLRIELPKGGLQQPLQIRVESVD